MSIALLLIHDGRCDYRERTLESLEAAYGIGLFDHYIEVDDTPHKLGFAGAIQEGWRRVLETDAEFCAHVEGDFTFNRALPVPAMVDVLRAHPHLVQMALLRQPWNDQEKAAGGIVQMHPAMYEPVEWNGHRWLEHRRNVTTNPCIWPRWVLERGWPQQPQSEGHFGIDLFAENAELRAAYWGDGEPWVHHIGDVRAGTGY